MHSKKNDLFTGKIRTLYGFEILPYLSDFPGAFQLNKLLGLVNNFFVERPEGEVFSPYERDWDVLIILDACRYDYYRKFFPETDKRVTRASHSREYFKENYSSGEFNNTIYLSANPHVSPQNFRQSTGRDIQRVFHKVRHLTVDSWDNDLGVVPPEKVTDAAVEAENESPEKRKIVHFMQPHKPFINTDSDWAYEEVWKGERSHKELEKAYRDNIEVVLSEIERLKEEMEGKIVVTADHGELLGEYNLYGHLYGVKAKDLREVPWHVIKDEKKAVEPENIEDLDV